MVTKGSGWHGEPRRHAEAVRKGLKTRYGRPTTTTKRPLKKQPLIKYNIRQPLLDYAQPEYDGLQTDPEILQAIEAIYSGNILNKQSKAYSVWENGYDTDRKKIKQFLDKEHPDWKDDGLWWGSESLK